MLHDCAVPRYARSAQVYGDCPYLHVAASSRVAHSLPISVPSCVHASNNVGSCRPMKAKSVEYAYTKKRQSNIEKARAARWSNATAAVSCPYLPRLVYVSCMMRRRGSLVVTSVTSPLLSQVESPPARMTTRRSPPEVLFSTRWVRDSHYYCCRLL